MSPYIRITRKPYEEPYHLNLVMEASNGEQQWKFEYYASVQSLIEWATHLEVFPRHKDDVFLSELGSERPEDRWAYYFRFRVFTTDSVGHCAIQLRFNNNEELPHRQIAEFCIEAEAAQVNRFGQLCRHFAKLQHTVLEWNGNDGSLHEAGA